MSHFKSFLLSVILLLSTLSWGQETLWPGQVAPTSHETLKETADSLQEAYRDEEWMTPDLFVEVMSGVQQYHFIGDYNAQYFNTTGVSLYFRTPKAHKNLLVKTGFAMSRMNFPGDETSSQSLIKIPFHVGFTSRKGIFRPRVSYGMNVYLAERLKYHEMGLMISPTSVTVSANAGGVIKLADRFFMSLMAEVESESNLFLLPKKLYAHTFQVGLTYKVI